MRKEIIKCDKCGKMLDYENSSEDNCEFYNLTIEHIKGWASIDRSFGANTTFQICLECFGLLDLKR